MQESALSFGYSSTACRFVAVHTHKNPAHTSRCAAVVLASSRYGVTASACWASSRAPRGANWRRAEGTRASMGWSNGVEHDVQVSDVITRKASQQCGRQGWVVQRSEEFEQISNHTVALDPAGYLDRLSHLTAAGFCQVSQWETERSGYNRPSNALDARAKANGALWRSFQACQKAAEATFLLRCGAS